MRLTNKNIQGFLELLTAFFFLVGSGMLAGFPRAGAEDAGTIRLSGAGVMRLAGNQAVIAETATDLTTWGDWSLGAWLHIEVLASRQTVLGLHEGTPYLSIGVHSDGNISVWHRDGDNRRLRGMTSAGPFAARCGDWVHVVVTLERAARAITVYVDGEPVDFDHVQRDAVAGIRFSRNPVLGGMNTGGGPPNRWFLQGMMADVRVASRVWNQSEVTATYESGRRQVGEWPSGMRAADDPAALDEDETRAERARWEEIVASGRGMSGELSFEAAGAEDWPMWRYEPGRGAATTHRLAAELHLQWVLQLPEPEPGWHPLPDHPGKLDFDSSYEPIVAGNRLIVGSMIRDRVTAYCVQTAGEKWRFYADGPVRFAPVAANGRVYFVSDDGYLYCVDGRDGQLVWKRRGGPSARRVLGNRRLINTWPARGAPVVEGNVVYFAAGIWPFMGVWLHAVDARTGEPIWTNSSCGLNYSQLQVFNEFSGVAPQGYLALAGDTLLVPNGLTVPAAFDRSTGELRYFQQLRRTIGRQGAGGYRVMAQAPWFFNHGRLYSLEDGAAFGAFPDQPVLNGSAILVNRNGRLVAYAAEPEREEAGIIDRLQRDAIRNQYSLKELLDIETSAPLQTLHIQAGNRVYGTLEKNVVAAVDLPGGEVTWHAELEGEIRTILAAARRLFVVTSAGRIYSFGEAAAHVTKHAPTRPTDPQIAPQWRSRVAHILENTELQSGYALVLEAGSLELLQTLAQQSELHVIAVEADPQRVEDWRRTLDDNGLYGSRVSVLAAELTDVRLPPYLADLILCGPGLDSMPASVDEESSGDSLLPRIFDSLRPYGGVAWCLDAGLLFRRETLPGAGDWTHEYADAANTVYSPEQRVQAPLGLLWFGGPSNERVLPRHGDGPIPQVVQGRLLIMGPDHLTARCVYSGREIWQIELPGVGAAFDSTQHQLGTNLIGSNYVSVADGVYVAHDRDIHWLDPESGELRDSFRFTDPDGEDVMWSAPRVCQDLLIVAAGPRRFEEGRIGGPNLNHSASRHLVVMDRFSGEVRWTRAARYGFQHNAIAAAAGRIYAIDALRPAALDRLARRGVAVEQDARLLALDAATGELLWESANVFGTWLGYSREHDLLVQAGRGRVSKRGHALPDEPDQFKKVFCGSTGQVIWSRSGEYLGPLNLHGNMIVTTSHSRGESAPFVDLRTGEAVLRCHPLSQQSIPFTYRRDYGCGTALASRHLLAFRSGSAAYYDLKNQGGTANLGGFRSGCTNNLVPAGGVLNAPDYTRTCRCPFQNQTSLALIHDPQVEWWSYDNWDQTTDAVRRMGINFGAPGQRRSPNGLLWLNYTGEDGEVLFRGPRTEAFDAARQDIPMSVRSAPAQVHLEPTRDRDWFRNHAQTMQGPHQQYNWVASSGVKGLTRIRVSQLQAAGLPTYRVRLFFSEPEPLKVGERVFEVRLQGQPVATDLDVVRATGGANRLLVLDFQQIPLDERDEVVIEFVPAQGSRPSLVCGVELQIEEFDDDG